MKFQSFGSLVQALKSHDQYKNDIKLKRLKKELQILSNYQNQATHIQNIQLTSVGIQLLISNHYREGSYKYKLILDFEYPFNRPQIFYMSKDSQFARCKDLIDILLGGINWGPSLMLTYFLEKMQDISEVIRKNNPLQTKWMYHKNQCYRKAQLQGMQIKLFQVQQYTWRYLIRTTKLRYLAVSDETFFLFSTTKADQNLLLQFWKPISEILTAKATLSTNKKFNLEISYRETDKEMKLYFGGESNVQAILGYLNPIQMIQRKVSSVQKNINNLTTNRYWQDSTEMIKQFTQLIQHYSLKDSGKSQKYIKLMKQVIGKFYQTSIKSQPNNPKKAQIQMQEQQIQT